MDKNTSTTKRQIKTSPNGTFDFPTGRDLNIGDRITSPSGFDTITAIGTDKFTPAGARLFTLQDGRLAVIWNNAKVRRILK